MGFADWTSDKPEHWVFEGTDMKQGDRVAQLVGWEYHGPPLAKHHDLVVLSEGPVYAANGSEADRHLRHDALHRPQRQPGLQCRNVLVERRALDSAGFQNPPRRDFLRNDARIQRITHNILDRMIATKTGAVIAEGSQQEIRTRSFNRRDTRSGGSWFLKKLLLIS